MRFYTVLTAMLFGAAVFLSSCQTPQPGAYGRPPNALKFHSAGYNPGTHAGRHGHRH